MTARLFALLISCSLATSSASGQTDIVPTAATTAACLPAAAPLLAQQRAVAEEVNLARTDPRGYAKLVQAFFANLGTDGVHRRGRSKVRMSEGRRAVADAIAFLNRIEPRAPLALNTCLSQAAQDHAADLGATGSTEHVGADRSQPWERATRRLGRRVDCGENLGFGSETAREDVISLIVDDGVPSRGHRLSLLAEQFRSLGIGVGAHPRYRVVVAYLVCLDELPGE